MPQSPPKNIASASSQSVSFVSHKSVISVRIVGGSVIEYLAAYRQEQRHSFVMPSFGAGKAYGISARLVALILLNINAVKGILRMRWNEIKEDAPIPPKPRVELSRVILAKPVESEDGVIPAGSAGTILHVYPKDTGYDVEFSVPHPYTVVSVKADDLVP